MASTFEPLSRTTSGESVRSHSSIQLLSNAPSSRGKGPHVDTETSGGEVDRASISMPPPAIKPNIRYQSMSPPRSSSIADPTMLRSGVGQSDSSSVHTQNVPEQQSQDLNSSLLSSGSSQDSPVMRKSDPEIGTKRMSFSSLYNSGKSAPSSVAGGSDQDGVRLRSALAADEADERTAQYEGSNRATTATQRLTVTASSQNGALSPSLDSSLREPLFTGSATQVTNASPGMTSPSSPTSYTAKEGRTVRGAQLQLLVAFQIADLTVPRCQ